MWALSAAPLFRGSASYRAWVSGRLYARGTCRCQPAMRPLRNQVALETDQRSKQVENKFAGSTAVFDLLG